MTASWISKTDRCGAMPAFGQQNPRRVLVNYRRLGGTDAGLLRDYPSLTPADL